MPDLIREVIYNQNNPFRLKKKKETIFKVNYILTIRKSLEKRKIE